VATVASPSYPSNASTTSTISVTDAAWWARSASNGGRPSGTADHTPMPGLVRSPLTVVTSPSEPGSALTAGITAAMDWRTKLLNGPPAKACLLYTSDAADEEDS